MYNRQAPLFSEARAISKFVQEGFLKGEYHQVDVLFTNFVSTLTQRPEVISLLPLHEISAVQAAPGGEKPGLALLKGATEFLFEPSTHEVLGALLPHYLNYRLYQVLLEAKASEHSARMVAMNNATDNAAELVDILTLERNKARQARITNEILDIVGGAEALKNM